MSDEEFLAAVREYIEGCEQTIDGEWGLGRDYMELIRDGEMPDLYHEVIKRQQALKSATSFPD